MSHLKRTIAVFAALISIALVTTACGKSSSSGTVFHLAISEPKFIDPYNSNESEGQAVTRQLYVGLVTLDLANLHLTPGVAKTWTRNDDCTEWTFKLRNDSKFSNGETVDAQSFIRGWNRAAAQKAASDVAYLMASVDGFEDVNGSSDEDAPPATATKMSGLSAPDQFTLKAKLAQTDCDFAYETLHPVFSPVPKDAGAYNNKEYNHEPIGNGPFKLKEAWNPSSNDDIVLVRNSEYFGAQPAITEAQFKIVTGSNAGQDEYDGGKNGTFDYARVPKQDAKAAKTWANSGSGRTYVKKTGFGVTFLNPTFATKPLNVANARRALSMSIDRDAVIKNVLGDSVVAADSLTPPVFVDYYEKGICDACKYDPTTAKSLAASSGLRAGTEVKITYPSDGDDELAMQAFEKQIEDTLGITVTLNPITLNDMLSQLGTEDQEGFYELIWTADYPAVNDILHPILSSNGYTGMMDGDTFTGYNNATFDTEMEAGQTATDEEVANQHFLAAEKQAIGKDVAVIPLWYRTYYYIFNSGKFKNVRTDFFENVELASVKPVS